MSGVGGWKLCINCNEGFRPTADGRNKKMCLRCFEFSELGELPEKPCNACGKQFQPTDARRMLCALCFRGKNYSTQGYLSAKVAIHGAA